MDQVDTLRPSDWEDFVGQQRVKDELDVAISAAVSENRPLGHVLLCAPPGTGKTSLAALIAKKLGDQFEAIAMPSLRPGSFASFFRCYDGGVVLLDEIHAAHRMILEQSLTLLEEGYLTTPGGARVFVGWVTVIAATTERDKLPRALRQRFEFEPRFLAYTDEEMTSIVCRMAAALSVEVDDDTALALGRAAGGVPRNARRLVLKARDLQVRDGRPSTVEAILQLAGVADDGLSDEHLAYLQVLDRQDGVAGLDTLRMILGLAEPDIRELERFLLERRMILYGNRGRELTTLGTRRVRPASAPQGRQVHPMRRSA